MWRLKVVNEFINKRWLILEPSDYQWIRVSQTERTNWSSQAAGKWHSHHPLPKHLFEVTAALEEGTRQNCATYPQSSSLTFPSSLGRTAVPGRDASVQLLLQGGSGSSPTPEPLNGHQHGCLTERGPQGPATLKRLSCCLSSVLLSAKYYQKKLKERPVRFLKGDFYQIIF